MNGNRPPLEVVLPTFYYVVLITEGALLAYFWATHDIAAGDSIGRAIGWTGTGSMVVMHVYSIRKRVRALASWGRLSTWLHVHIFLGLQGALLVCFHSAHLTTVGNIAGVTIACTLVVVASGMFGRYLFSFLPRSATGQRLSARDIEGELAALEPRITTLSAAHPSMAAAVAEAAQAQPITGRMSFRQLVGEDLRARRALRHLERALRAAALQERASADLASFAALLRRRALLARRLAMLTGAERAFRNWHLFHKPLTFVLLGAVVLHVTAHYIYAARFAP